MNQDKSVNYGICLLRSVMCLSVIFLHFRGFYADDIAFDEMPPLAKLFERFADNAVPTFMFMSLFFTQKSFVAIDKNIIKKRMFRLIIPFVFWGIAPFAIYMFLQLFNLDFGIKTSDLFWQIVGGGSEINGPLWYVFDLIVISGFFYAVFYFLKKKNGVAAVIIVACIAVVLEYTEINYRLFLNFRYELKWPIGRLIEMIPYAASGFLYSYFDIISKLNTKIKKYVYFVVIYVLTFAAFYINIIVGFNPKGYTYNYLVQFFLTIAVFSTAFCLPLEKLPSKLLNHIQNATRYTLGIYCLHILIMRFIFIAIEKNNVKLNCFLIFGLSLFVYALGYLISFLIDKIPWKICKSFVS